MAAHSSSAHRQLSVADLSDDQRGAYEAVRIWLDRGSRTKRILSIGGYAGVGKSTVVSVIAHEMRGPIAFVSFTGKASSNLGAKLAVAGIPTTNKPVVSKRGERPYEPRPYCGTIHGLIYQPCSECMGQGYEHTYGEGCRERLEGDDEAVTGELEASPTAEDRDPFASSEEAAPVFAPATSRVLGPPGPCRACDPPPPVQRTGPCPKCKDARFIKRGALDRPYQTIIIDEASMVSSEMETALLSFGVPLLAVGDHGQLPPVSGQGTLMLRPDIRLEKIHRQAEGNPIIQLSKYIRETGGIDDGLEDGDAFTILAQRDLQAWVNRRFVPGRLGADLLRTAMISWTNKARCALNERARLALGFSKEVIPQKGEVVICLKNAPPIYNGMRGVLTADAKPWATNTRAPKVKMAIDFVEDGQVAKSVLAANDQFFAEKTISYEQAQEMGTSLSSLGALYDMGYAMTCHKMQGSQADEVMVLVEGGLSRLSREERTRWLYTSVTRASRTLCLVR